MPVTIDGTSGVNTPSLTTSGSTVPVNGLYLPTTNTLGLATNSVERVRIDASGNLGIGTTSPAQALHVVSTGNQIKYPLRLQNDGTSGITLGAGLQLNVYNGTSVANLGAIIGTGSTWSYGTYSANQVSISSVGSGGVRVATASAPITFHTGNADSDLSTERMRINSSGNVGIGTSSPSYRFDVSGASASGIARFANAWGDGTNPAILVDGTGGDGRLVQIKSGGTRSWPLLWVTASTTDVLVVNGDSTIKTAGTISVGGATPSTSGAGITFPATQSASTDANTLDDYEEGTWTPVVTSTGGTYANQAGRYTKVGRVVTCDFFVQNASTFTYASLSAFFTITGLPFTPTSWSYNGVTGTVWTQGFNYNNDQSASVKFVTPVATSSATILFKTSDSAATAGTIINSNNSGFIITGQVIFTV